MNLTATPFEEFDLDHLRTLHVHTLARAYHDFRVSNQKADGRSRLLMAIDSDMRHKGGRTWLFSVMSC